jgi:acetyl esterase/lipase
VHGAAQPSVISLWPDRAPGSQAWTEHEQEGLLPAPYAVEAVWNVSRPALTAYVPDPAVASGAVAIVCPGGEFHFLSIKHEGTQVARWLVVQGIAAFVLKYRLLRTPATAEGVVKQIQETFGDRDQLQAQVRQLYPLITADGQQAMRVVRRHAPDWGLSPDRIGILGFSADATVAVGAAVRYAADTRPSFAAPIYTAPGPEIAVLSDAPPLFLALAADDDMAVRTSMPLYAAWRAADRSAEVHIFARGGHGFGVRKQGLPSDRWTDLFGDWLSTLGVLERAR